ncbi:hypothetical protein M569_16347, partial [Genlisea aurea]
VEVTCFSEASDDHATLHFQIIRLHKQIYVWIGYNSSKLGHLYVATPTRPSNAIGVTSLIGGGAENTGSSIARRLALKTGLSIVLGCNIPKNHPMLEAKAEKMLAQKLIELRYAKPKP